jgi:outer membrane lipoprotein-sorting protein
LRNLKKKQITIKLNKSFKIIFLFPALIFSACSGSGSDNGLEKIPIRDIKQRVNRNSNLIETLEASGNISFDSPEQSGTGWIEVKIKKPDTVYVKIEGPFGISIANALITRQDFLYYNAQENKAIMGPSTDINIGAILRVKVSFDELINGFTGAFSLDESPDDSTGANSENNLYVIQSNNSKGKQKYFVEPSRFTIQKYNYLDNNNMSLVEVDYSSYQEESAAGKNVNFPAAIKIKNPINKQTVYVDYVNKEINKKGLTFKIKIPKSASIIKWE